MSNNEQWCLICGEYFPDLEAMHKHECPGWPDDDEEE